MTIDGALDAANRDAAEVTTPALSLSGITVRFGGITALQDVDLQLESGEVRGLIGPNGAGKTTLFDVISGIRLPDAGRVKLDDDDVTRLSAVRRARRGLRRTFQRVQTFGWLSVEDNVLAALDWNGGGGGLVADLVSFPTRRARETKRRERVDEVLEVCGLTAVRRESAGSLPIGLGRMVELARAIVDTLYGAVRAYCGAQAQLDDMTVIIIKAAPPVGPAIAASAGDVQRVGAGS